MQCPKLSRWIFPLIASVLAATLRAEDIRINLDHRDDPRARPRVTAEGFAIHVEADGHLQRLEPTTIRIETQQKGRWMEPRLDVGRLLTTEFNSDKPDTIRIETTLKLDLGVGEQRYSRERDAIHREAQKRAGGKDAVLTKVRTQLLLERINAIREENVRAGADKRGRATLYTPPLPRQALNFERPDALERLLKEQCCWQSVAQVFKATQFQPPDDKEHPEFAAAMTMAEEVRQAMMGIKFTPRFLTESQHKALEQGSRYQFTARFVPELPAAEVDMLWKNAPAVRLAEGLVKRATLEGGLDRQRGQTVAWWRVECDSPARIQSQLIRGDGDCFWSWVESPEPHVRYVRLLLHSPGTRYRMNLSLAGATKGEELTLYDGPLNPPLKAPF